MMQRRGQTDKTDSSQDLIDRRIAVNWLGSSCRYCSLIQVSLTLTDAMTRTDGQDGYEREVDDQLRNDV